MTYKTILVHLDDGKHHRARIDVAARIALTCNSHLVGLYAVDWAWIPSAGPGPLAAPPSSVCAADIAVQTSQAHSAFDRQVGQHEISGVEFRSGSGDALSAATLHARYADLLVIGQAAPDEPECGVEANFPELLVLAAGRPVLIVPYYTDDYLRLGQRILVAWNASREATRAVSDALPLLQRAQLVTIMAVNAEPGTFAHGDIPGADLAHYLARHGVKAQVSPSYTDQIDVGDDLLARASDLDIDLIVMGAYGHSRLREIVLGGVTQKLLRHMTVPVLMSH
jgi:nucleotide-binding universal stress UspA family protein